MSGVVGATWLVAALSMTFSASGQSPPRDEPAAAPASDSAESEDPRKTQARESLRLAAQLAAQGQWIEALGSYERSASLWPHPTTTYNIAFTERALGRYTRALIHFHQVLADPALRDQLRAQAEGYAQELRAQLAHVSVSLPDPRMRIAVDGRPLASEAAFGAPAVLLAGVRPPGPGEVLPQASVELLLDPGDHIFVVWPADGPAITIAQSLAVGQHAELTLPPPDRESPASHARSPPSKNHEVPVIAVAGFATAGVGLVVGAITGALALSTSASVEEQCDAEGFCPQSAGADIDRGFALANAANVSFAIAGAATAVGLVGWLAAGPTEPDAEPALEVGLGAGTVHIRGEF